MDIQQLAQRLRDPDPRIRVEALRILAMVEETRALGVVRWVYLHDPEPGVREVANWTGRLLWEAHQRGHSTERALEDMFKRPMSPESQIRFLESFEFDVGVGVNLKARRFAAEQTFRRRLDEALRPPDQVGNEDAGGEWPPARIPPRTGEDATDRPENR
jgi:hypothetical protein